MHWQRRHPNSLWQCDLKIVGAKWLIAILDDHSRFITGSELFKEGTAENVIRLLDQAIHEYSKPRESSRIMGHNSGVYAEENPDSKPTAKATRSSIF